MTDIEQEAIRHVRKLIAELKPYHVGRRVRDCAACDVLADAQAWLSRVEQSAAPPIQPVIETAGELERLTAEVARLQPYHDELLKIAETLGEPDDPFAAWESIEAMSAKLATIEWETIERCAKLVEGGSFLHDQSPAYQFAREVARAIRALNPVITPVDEMEANDDN